MAVLDDLKSGSYRGVTFFYVSSTETGGFKSVAHLYPGSNNFQVEQLGQSPRKFSVECRVLFQNRESFDFALNTEGTGILSHPMYGNFGVKVITYTKSDSVTDLGVYDYSIEFAIEQGFIIPTVQGISTFGISRARVSLATDATALVKDKLKEFGF